MHAMIGLPSGEDRVRWNPSATSPHPSTTASTVAPRARALARLSSTSAPAPSAITNPSRSLLNGRDADAGGSFRVDSADSSENRIRLSGLTDASVPTTSAASVSPRRIASTPSWIAVPPDAQAVEVATGEPFVPNRSARASPTEPNRNRR